MAKQVKNNLQIYYNKKIQQGKMLADQKNSTEALLGGNKGNSQLSTKSSPAPSQPVVNNQKIQSRQSIVSQRQKSRRSKSKSQTQFTSVLRFLNFIIGLGVVAFGVACYKFFNEDTEKLDFVGIILPGYISLSGLIIVLIECKIKLIIRNMKFLYNFIGRGIFNIYVGIMPLTMIRMNADPQQNKMFQVIIFIMVSLMVLIGVLYILAKIFCCAKEDGRRKRKNSSDDDDDD